MAEYYGTIFESRDECCRVKGLGIRGRRTRKTSNSKAGK